MRGRKPTYIPDQITTDIEDAIWHLWSTGEAPGVRSLTRYLQKPSVSTVSRWINEMYANGELEIFGLTIWPPRLFDAVERLVALRQFTKPTDSSAKIVIEYKGDQRILTVNRKSWLVMALDIVVFLAKVMAAWAEDEKAKSVVKAS